MIEDQLQGLILPSQENGFNAVLWLGLLLLATLLGLALWRWWKSQNTPLSKARKALESLIKRSSENTSTATHNSSANNKQVVALQCSQILCAGFAVKHLDQYQATNADQWQLFYKKLNSLCYSNESNIELDPLLQQAKSFLLKENRALNQELFKDALK